MHKRKNSSEVYPHTGKRQIHAAPHEQSEDIPHVEAPGPSLAPPTYTTAFAIRTESSFSPHHFPTAVDIANHHSETPSTESSLPSVNEASIVSHKTSVVSLGPVRSKILKLRNRLEQDKGASSDTTWPNTILDAASPYITMHSVRNNVQGHSADHLLAKDLPHSGKNGANTDSTLIPNFPKSRLVIESGTKEGDIDAPPILIYDENDDDITTHFDFHYTDQVLHGEGVPVSNLKLLQGCNCDGVCDPRSKECQCVARQSKHVPGRTGFVYNKMGQLIEKLHYPIFECNTFCTCGEECKNRVVQQGRKCMVNLVRTQNKGLGVFSGFQKIPAGTFVGIYSGELLTDSTAKVRTSTYIFSLDPYYLQEGNSDWKVKYAVDAGNSGNFTRFINHSCEPNCLVTYCYIDEGDLEKPLIAIFTRRDIPPRSEITISYFGITSEIDDDDSEDKETNEDGEMDEAEEKNRCRCGSRGCRGFIFSKPQ